MLESADPVFFQRVDYGYARLLTTLYVLTTCGLCWHLDKRKTAPGTMISDDITKNRFLRTVDGESYAWKSFANSVIIVKLFGWYTLTFTGINSGLLESRNFSTGMQSEK